MKSEKTKIIQVRHPMTGEYVKIDRTHGFVLDRSDKPHLNIPLLKLPHQGRNTKR